MPRARSSVPMAGTPTSPWQGERNDEQPIRLPHQGRRDSRAWSRPNLAASRGFGELRAQRVPHAAAQVGAQAFPAPAPRAEGPDASRPRHGPASSGGGARACGWIRGSPWPRRAGTTPPRPSGTSRACRAARCASCSRPPIRRARPTSSNPGASRSGTSTRRQATPLARGLLVRSRARPGNHAGPIPWVRIRMPHLHRSKLVSRWVESSHETRANMVEALVRQSERGDERARMRLAVIVTIASPHLR